MRLVGIVVAATLGWTTFAGAAGTAADRCEASKLHAAGKKSYCRAREAAKGVLGHVPGYAKCDAAFVAAFAKAEASAGSGVCPTQGDAPALETHLDAAGDAVLAALAGTRFVDNGDGTVTDTQTRLVWEQKTDDGTLHDKDELYTWSNGVEAPDGTAFTVFLGGLNNCASAGGYLYSGGFAGHCDWRLPTITELWTIFPVCPPGPPCLDPVFGPLGVASAYWSGTTGSDPATAWFVHYGVGGGAEADKNAFGYVRAVRGGW